MIQHTDHFHGSDLEKIEQTFGIRKEEIISFSANINPLGLSENLKAYLSSHLDVITTYPDREYTGLSNAISEYTKCNPENIIVGNGATELISLFFSAISPKKALIIGPTYSEYEREISLSGGQIHYYFTKEENDFRFQMSDFLMEMKKDYDLVILCNPNNPTSTTLTKRELSTILSKLNEQNGYLLVDETYVEFVDNVEEISAVSLTEQFSNLVVLRGISKFFASPGLRLGYGITGNKDLLSFIKEHKNPWTINSVAEAAGSFMFRDKAYIKKTSDYIKEERNFVCKSLASIEGLKIYKSTCNFVLVKITKEGINADILFDYCIKKKFMIRNCSSFQSLNNLYFRVCFMRHEDNLALLNSIKEAMEQAYFL
ncbi:MAG: aminotransferase class I/II-fold pyridoxal phosphate-dependent enzyme [Lachnospiraceae bacterium]|nr:aminotransferase class I/II-fold pyridoxal phosphate-dependent enzyme [Lachnospiraceae bacterium]